MKWEKEDTKKKERKDLEYIEQMNMHENIWWNTWRTCDRKICEVQIRKRKKKDEGNIIKEGRGK